MGGAVQQCGHSVGIRVRNASLAGLRNPLYRLHPKHSGGGATTRRGRHMGGGESRRPWVGRRLRNRQGAGVSPLPVYQFPVLLCSHFPNALPAMVFVAHPRNGEKSSDGAKRMSRPNRHEGGCCGQSPTASSRSREGPPRDQAHRGEWDFHRGAVVKIFLLGATANSGLRILRLALQRDHEVNAFVRDDTKLLSLVDRPIPPNLHVSIGEISKSADIARVMVGHDVAINAAGTVTEGATFTQLIQTVVDSTIRSLGEGGRLWQFGGAAILNVPGTHIMAVDLPKVPKVYEAHRTNL